MVYPLLGSGPVGDDDLWYHHIPKTIPIGGKFSKEQKLIYEIVLDAQKNAIESAVIGSNSSTVHNVALKILVEGLKEIGLLRGSTEEIIDNGLYKHLYMHRTGHWLGLDVHDVGAYKGRRNSVGSEALFKLEEGTPDVGEFLSLRVRAGMRPRSPEGAKKGLGQELFSVLLRLESSSEIVGMGRVIGDGGTIFVICDMLVIEEFQRKRGGPAGWTPRRVR